MRNVESSGVGRALLLCRIVAASPCPKGTEWLYKGYRFAEVLKTVTGPVVNDDFWDHYNRACAFNQT